MNDVTALSQLVLQERQSRDRGWWQWMAAAFVPDAPVRLSWIDGTARDFVAGSRAMAEGGSTATHRMAAPVVRVVGDRALVEAPAVIEVRSALDGVEVDLASRARLLYTATRDGDDDWLLTSLDCVYESDSITPTLPGTTPAVDAARWSAGRASYRWLAYVLGGRGHTVASDLPGDDDPPSVARLYDERFAWLGADPRDVA